MQVIPASITARTLRELANGLQQFMFFWGQDILHPAGNIMVQEGFSRRPSTGLKGTSCYHRPWQGGALELYGSCAGWYGKDGGFTFIRPQKRCVIWDSGEETPIPGVWQPECIKKCTREELHQAAQPFLDWLLSYEENILEFYGEAYRVNVYQRYCNVSHSKPWKEPTDAIQWFKGFRDSPEELSTPSGQRATHF